jgi:hypothetical protein
MTFTWRCVYAAIAIEAVVVALCALIGHAGARDLGQWETTDPEIAAWYRSLKQPDNPAISCCGEADAYWADNIIVEGGKVLAVVTDERPDEPLGRPHIAPGTRFEIPPNKMKSNGGNPTGHNVLFVGPGGVYCFVTGTLS